MIVPLMQFHAVEGCFFIGAISQLFRFFLTIPFMQTHELRR